MHRNLFPARASVSLILWYVSIDFDVKTTVEAVVERGTLVGARSTTRGPSVMKFVSLLLEGDRVRRESLLFCRWLFLQVQKQFHVSPVV